MTSQPVGSLAGVKVIEIADEQAEFCGLILAGLGADVVKVEPPGGSPTRRIGPFYEGRDDPERSLFFWNYNRGKRSIVLDLGDTADRARVRSLVSTADILLESTPRGQLEAAGLGVETLRHDHPSLIIARMSGFGDVGPWAGYRGSDLVHLALSGVMMNCGYDPDPSGHYDLPPIAPQVWQAYHIAGDQMVIGVLAALLYRQRTGEGQVVSCAIHEAVAKNTELDVTSWVMRRMPLYRQTCQHAAETVYRVPTIAATKDGRWLMTRWQDDRALASFLRGYGLAADLEERLTHEKEAPTHSLGRPIPGTTTDGRVSEREAHEMDVVERFCRAFTYANAPWREAQNAGLMFAPLRKPHENAVDEHWLARGALADVDHPEMGRSFRYAVSRWNSTANPWNPGRRAPKLDEDRDFILQAAAPRPSAPAPANKAKPGHRSARGKPFALDGIRILDFSWFLASAGGTRFLAALGAHVIKVEWKGHPDTRFGVQAPEGGRAARDRATKPLPGVVSADMGGQFNNKNPGKRGISLNVRDPRGLEIAKRLVALSDVVAEGFSPGVLDRWGLGYDVLRSIRPDIIYAQQSAAGQRGTYGRFKAIGPIAQSITGLSEMSGLPEPAMPAGWGYSYLDWVGAYSFATAILAALHHRARTGEGQWIDASQCEAGLFLTGVPILDWSANRAKWSRYGNRSPYKRAAPHGAYRCSGEDRWLAIACFAEADWRALARVAGHDDWLADPRYSDLDARIAHQDELDATVNDWTRTVDAYVAMERLQLAGVAAGVCQTAEDRLDKDEQLARLEWLTEVTGTRIGRWPLPEMPVKLSESPSYIGGPTDRGAPYYGEDNAYVFGELLGMSSDEIANLAEENVI